MITSNILNCTATRNQITAYEEHKLPQGYHNCTTLIHYSLKSGCLMGERIERDKRIDTCHTKIDLNFERDREQILSKIRRTSSLFLA